MVNDAPARGRSTSNPSPCPSPPSRRRRKRTRLPLACNPCRQRKVRCDTQLPQCQNCRRRGDLCETTDPGRAGAPAVRRRRPELESEPKKRRRIEDAGDAGEPRDGVDGVPSEASEAAEAAVQEHANLELASLPSGGSHPSPQHVQNGRDDASANMMVVSTHGPYRRKYLNGTLQCLCVYVDAYLCRKGLLPISSKFHHGMKQAEEFPLPLAQAPADLPPPHVLDDAVDIFSARILPLYPIIELSDLLSEAKRLRELQGHFSVSGSSTGGLQSILRPEDVPIVCIIYCVAVIGTDEQTSHSRYDGRPYLAAAYGFLGHLNAMPYLGSVQALFLLSIALRTRGKEGQAWHILGQAIRIAHSIGLHKHLPQRGGDSQSDLSSRIWWSCYALEKQMELEIGRPSPVRDPDSDRVSPQVRSPPGADQAPNFHALWVSLAAILGQISDLVFRRGSDRPNGLLHETGSLDRALQMWADALPEGQQPLVGASSCANSRQYQDVETFLRLQLYQAQISLFRAAIVLPPQSFTEAVQNCESPLPSRSRLLRADGICVEAARSMLKEALDVADNGSHMWTFANSQIGLPILVLVINIFKEPGKRMARLDRELVMMATELIQDQMRHVGHKSDFIATNQIIRDAVDAAIWPSVNVAPPEATSRPAANAGVNLGACEGSLEPTSVTLSGDEPAPVPFEMTSLDELWAMMETGPWAMNPNALFP